ncbi:pyrroline-5-carboxylate reductase [Synechococcus sp. M16CYN]|uniref:pyrroline-5-carboxylate reductase n=1 Tax=Synechococcus sp. M16CYN TaxID=3103139 RepID=UPI00324FD8B2
MTLDNTQSVFGVIGLGRMAQILVNSLLTNGHVAPNSLWAVVGSETSAQKRRAELPIDAHVLAATDPAASNVWKAPFQLLAVKPQQLEAVARSSAPVQNQPMLISILAGVPLDRLQRLFPGHCCVRAVPNTPALVRAGLTALAWGNEVCDGQQRFVKQLFSNIGEVLELPECKLDAFLALTSSGPAFIALVAEAMADGAVAAGLTRDLAHRLAHRTLAGTAELLNQRQLHPAELKDMVSSPGGTTIAGLRHLERAGLRSALIEAVVAAAERSRQLARPVKEEHRAMSDGLKVAKNKAFG